MKIYFIFFSILTIFQNHIQCSRSDPTLQMMLNHASTFQLIRENVSKIITNFNQNNTSLSFTQKECNQPGKIFFESSDKQPYTIKIKPCLNLYTFKITLKTSNDLIYNRIVNADSQQICAALSTMLLWLKSCP